MIRYGDPTLIFSPTRSYQLVSASWGCGKHPDAVYVWDLRTALPRVAELGPFVATYINRPTFPVVFSPDGGFLALAGYQITIWSMDDPEAADEDMTRWYCFFLAFLFVYYI